MPQSDQPNDAFERIVEASLSDLKSIYVDPFEKSPEEARLSELYPNGMKESDLQSYVDDQGEELTPSGLKAAIELTSQTLQEIEDYPYQKAQSETFGVSLEEYLAFRIQPPSEHVYNLITITAETIKSERKKELANVCELLVDNVNALMDYARANLGIGPKSLKQEILRRASKINMIQPKASDLLSGRVDIKLATTLLRLVRGIEAEAGRTDETARIKLVVGDTIESLFSGDN